MNLLKNKWFIAVGIVLVLGTVALMFRNQLKTIIGGFTKSPRGYYYRFTQGSATISPKNIPGYHIVFQYILLGPKNDTIENKSLEGVQIDRYYPLEPKNELEDAMRLSTPGSVIEILVPTDSLKSRAGDNIKVVALESGKNAKFILKVIDILNDYEFTAYQNKRKLERLQKEFNAMDDYALKHKKDWKLDTFNFTKYFIDNKTKEPRFMVGDMVEFNTEVYNLKGDLIINSGMEGRKYKMNIGQQSYDLKAFDEIMPYLAEGESGTFLVTSDMAYGVKGYLNIVAPNSPILIVIKDLKKLKQ